MPEVTLDFRPRIEPKHLDTLKQTVARMDPDDTLQIVVEREDAHQLEPIVRILDQHGLGHQPKGGHADSFYLFASRHLPQPRGPEPPEELQDGRQFTKT